MLTRPTWMTLYVQYAALVAFTSVARVVGSADVALRGMHACARRMEHRVQGNVVLNTSIQFRPTSGGTSPPLLCAKLNIAISCFSVLGSSAVGAILLVTSAALMEPWVEWKEETRRRASLLLHVSPLNDCMLQSNLNFH